MKQSLSKVTIRGVEQPVEVPIMEFDDNEFQNSLFAQWQRLLDLIAQIYDTPAALVTRLHKADLEVFAKSNSENNPFQDNEMAALGSGLYCETVIGTDKQFTIENALEDELWHDNPEIPLNMISYLGVPLKWPNGEVFGTICVMDSKTRKFHELNKKLLDECKQTLEKDLQMIVRNNQLNDSLALLKRTQEKVIAMERSKLTTSLVDTIAHEMNTPLGIALTTASALDHMVSNLDNDSTSSVDTTKIRTEFGEFTSLLHTSLGKAKSLMESFRNVASEQSKGEKETFNLHEHLHSIATIMASQLRARDISCEIVCPKDITLNTYSGLLSQVLEVLFNNTLAHAFLPNQRGKITLVCTQSERDGTHSSLTIEYRDSGKGIPKEHCETIFTPFFSVDENNQNSGMGLGIARDIVEKSLHGQIHCDPDAQGAKFIIQLATQE